MFGHAHQPPADLLRRTYYTPEELADLLDLSPYFIRSEARQGRLKAVIVEHRVVYVRRDDVLDWLHRTAR
ncbi:MAG: helix-turn-helix domain-containing protein [Sphaerobacter sp.]|nr:helix-turn-helix domain-containing protein [Sphaerobacter sp.]